MNCTTYYEPSFDELNYLSQSTLNNWTGNCRQYEEMLVQLIKLPCSKLWSVMSYDSEVIASLESYLLNASRIYRLHPLLKNIEANSVLSNIHKLMFDLWVRVLDPKESQNNLTATGKSHSELVRQIVDIPKLFCLLQLYGYGPSSDILRAQLSEYFSFNNNIFKAQLTPVAEDITQLFNQYAESDFELEDDNLGHLYTLVANVTDILFSLHQLVLIDGALSQIYTDSGLHEALVGFYSKYFSFIEPKCDDLFKKELIAENLFKFFRSQITLSQSSGLMLFHHLLQNNFVSVINPTNQFKTADPLMNVLSTVLGHKRFCVDYFSRFSFETEFRPLLENGELASIRDVLEYHKITLRSLMEEYLGGGGSAAERRADDVDDDGGSGVSPWINGLFSYNPPPVQQPKENQVDSTTTNTTAAPTKAPAPRPANGIRMDDEITAKERMIREMFPDFGDGFVYKCLEYFDFDNEKALDAILESNLPPHLESLSRALTKQDLLRVQEMAQQRQLEEQAEAAVVQSTVAAYDPTAKKDLVPSQIFIGKKDKFAEMQQQKESNKEKTIELMARMNAEEEEAKETVKTLIERGKLTKSDLQSNIEYVGMYDDEFDDTYENEDVSYDVADEVFEDDSEEEEDSGDNVPNGGGPVAQRPRGARTTQRQPVEKFAASQRYSKKQFYNRRNFARGKGPSQQPAGGESNRLQGQQQQQQSQPQNQQQQKQQHNHQQQQPRKNSQNQPPNQSGGGQKQPDNRDGRSNGPNNSNNRNSNNNNRSNPHGNRSQFRNPQSQNRGGGGGGGGPGGRR